PGTSGTAPCTTWPARSGAVAPRMGYRRWPRRPRSPSLALTARGQALRAASGLKLEQPAEAGVADLPYPVLVDRHARLAGQRRLAGQVDAVADRGLVGPGKRDVGDLGGGRQRER